MKRAITSNVNIFNIHIITDYLQVYTRKELGKSIISISKCILNKIGDKNFLPLIFRFTIFLSPTSQNLHFFLLLYNNKFLNIVTPSFLLNEVCGNYFCASTLHFFIIMQKLIPRIIFVTYYAYELSILFLLSEKSLLYSPKYLDILRFIFCFIFLMKKNHLSNYASFFLEEGDLYTGKYSLKASQVGNLKFQKISSDCSHF